MFKENCDHIQEDLFGTTSHLSNQQQKRLEKSKEHFLYENFFSLIDESIFEPLYFDNNGRPNAPINALVTALMLQLHNGWSVSFLIDQINFNLLIRTAIGLKTIDGTPFCEATYYNFQTRLNRHLDLTGENLIDIQFEKLTAQQLKKLKIKTGIQRMDSFQVMTNIKSRSRVELLVEVLIRLYRCLDISQQERICDEIIPYLEKSSQQFVYNLNKDDIPHELEKLGLLYHSLYEGLRLDCQDLREFKTFARVYREQFAVGNKKIKVRPPKDVGSGSLQSPDDLDATYRQKRQKAYKGYLATVTETASLDNEIQLITDICVDKNNVDDSTILSNRMEKLKKTTGDLEEIHVDGGYGSSSVDQKGKENDITIVQTAVKGRKASVEMEVNVDSETGKFMISCPCQTVEATEARRKMKAEFSLKECKKCPLADQCPTQKGRKYRVFRFAKEDVVAMKRKQRIREIPPERRTLRANVEATVKEFTKGLNPCGKIKKRGQFGATLHVICSALAINMGRIYRLKTT